jgi:hypothetical protein
MNHPTISPGPVAGWARVLAWIIVVASCLAVVGVLMGIMRGARLPPLPWYFLVVLAIAAVWGLPLFWIVAIRGRPPRYWFGLGSQHWQSR